jgi:hypothetical protein
MRFHIAVPIALTVACLASAVPAAAQLDPTCPAVTATRLRLRKLDYPLGGQRTLFRGMMPLPAGVVIDPSVTGMRFLMTDDAGTVMSDVTIPGGTPTAGQPGWVGNRLGGSWSFIDRFGTLGGLRRVQLRRLPSGTSARILIYGQEMTFAAPVRHVYVHVYLTSDTGAVVCASRYFHELGCSYRNNGGKLNCY